MVRSLLLLLFVTLASGCATKIDAYQSEKMTVMVSFVEANAKANNESTVILSTTNGSEALNVFLGDVTNNEKKGIVFEILPEINQNGYIGAILRIDARTLVSNHENSQSLGMSLSHNSFENGIAQEIFLPIDKTNAMAGKYKLMVTIHATAIPDAQVAEQDDDDYG